LCWRALLLWIAAFLPALVLAWAISANQVNTLFMDDWHCVEMLQKHADGTVKIRDYFAGYLEHRPVVMRALYVAAMKMSGGDLRWIQWTGFLLQTGLAVMLACFVRRLLGRFSAPLAMGAANLFLFSPLMWQGWLWGGMTIYYFPPFFLLLGCSALAKVGWRASVRWALAFLCGLMAVYSLGPGFPVLALLAALAWRIDAMPRPGWKPKIAGAGIWIALVAAVVFVYFHDLRNEVHPDHAYGLGEEQTVNRGLAACLRNPLVVFKFALAVVGGSLIRGPLLDPGRWAAPVGAIALVLALLAGIRWVRGRSGADAAAAGAVIALAFYGIGSGFLVAMGRAWLVKGESISPALNIRYVCVGSYTWAALLVLTMVFLRQRKADWHTSRWLGFGAGVHVVWQSVLWLYGLQMMEEWKAARLRGAAALHFLNVAVAPGHKLSEPSLPALREWSSILNGFGLLHPPMARDGSLAGYKLGRPRSIQNAALSHVYRNAFDEITVAGYGMQNSHKSPDAVLLARRPQGTGDWQVFHVVTYDVPPLRAARAIMTDQTFIQYDSNLKAGRNPSFSEWSAQLQAGEIPEGKWEISAWEYDHIRSSVSPYAGLFLIDKSPGDLRIVRLSENEAPRLSPTERGNESKNSPGQP
jgi:hypothetical protein